MVDLRCVRDRKIQIFRKSISLEIALLEAGTALEEPGAGECSVRVDASENPAEHIVLFNDSRSKGYCVALSLSAIIPHIDEFIRLYYTGDAPVWPD